jgi:hypothetical protein
MKMKRLKTKSRRWRFVLISALASTASTIAVMLGVKQIAALGVGGLAYVVMMGLTTVFITLYSSLELAFPVPQ